MAGVVSGSVFCFFKTGRSSTGEQVESVGCDDDDDFLNPACCKNGSVLSLVWCITRRPKACFASIGGVFFIGANKLVVDVSCFC